MLIRWIGGKSRLAEQIIGTFPPHRKYIEPFFGGGSIFFKKRPVDKSYINDINSDLINLYTVVRDQPQELIRLLSYTPKDESQFNQWLDIYLNKKDVYLKLAETKQALIYYFIVKNSFNSMICSFGVGSSWLSDGVFETIGKVSRLLQDTTILNRDWKVTLDFADDNTLVYLDPPYAITIAEGNSYYEYKLTEKQHEELRDVIIGLNDKFFWCLSYDIHPLVDKLYQGVKGVFIHKTGEMFQSSINRHSRFVDAKTYDTAFKSEYLITNYPIIKALPLFGDSNAATQESLL